MGVHAGKHRIDVPSTTIVGIRVNPQAIGGRNVWPHLNVGGELVYSHMKV